MSQGRASASALSNGTAEPPSDIPHHLFGPDDGAPKLALVGGFGTADVNGVSVLSRLASFLRRAEGPGNANGAPRLKARVMIAPVAPEGTERLTRAAYRRIMLRSPDENLDYFPQVRLEAPDEDEREAACLFGLPVVERSPGQLADASLVSAWRRHGGESIDIAVGRSGQLDPGHCEVVFRALLAFMSRVELLEGIDVDQDDADLQYYDASRPFDLRCGARGLFVSHRRVGAWLQAGDSIGWVYDAFDGDPRHEVRTPVTGFLGALRRTPNVEEGAVAARVLSG